MAIIKHNKLIETSYKLSAREQFFVLHLISEISQNRKDLQEHQMHYSEIEKIINFDGKRRIANKSEVFSLMDKLNSEPIIYEKGSIIGKSVWLQHMEHDTETDIFTFSLSQRLREYLLQIKEHFTKYNISNIVYLNANAVRLYEVLKRYQFKGECEITVDKLKFYLGIEERYPKFYEFKRWVLIPSQREIKKFTDIRFDFVPAKKAGKRIISLKFYIYENEPKHSPDRIKILSQVDNTYNKKRSLVQTGSSGQDLKEQLSWAQYHAYRFLSEKGVNKRFIVDQVLGHEKLTYEPLRGYEDMYIKVLWKFFIDKTNADKPAGAFVSWWKKGRLTENQLHARMMEHILSRKKAMNEEELMQREDNKKRTMATAKVQSDVKNVETHQFVNNLQPFNLEYFKEEYPDQYRSFLTAVNTNFKEQINSAGQHFDPVKFRQAIETQVYHKCKIWYEEVN
ncbi:MAG: plasmid replication initiation protein [Polaribacter sp.]|jgi:plasmid replication initiation protein